MKSTILVAVSLFAISTLYAQTSDAEAEAIINLIGVQKREAIDKMVNVSVKDSVAFWKLYDEYQKTNMTTAKNRMKLYERTAASYGNMTPERADSLAKSYFVNRVEQENTLETYYKKIKAATNSVIAFEFFQAEVYLLTSLRASIMQQIPTYGEMLKARKNK